jgi:hypothetical protein
MGLIHDVKTNVHTYLMLLHLLYYNVLQNIVINANYSMLLRRPWLRDAREVDDWG